MATQNVGDGKRFKIGSAIAGLAVLSILAVLVWYVFFLFTGEGELAEKPVVVMLQGLSMDATNNRQSGPVLRTGAGHYVALGVPGTGRPTEDQGSGPASTRMWVILNEHSPSGTIRRINSYSGYELRCADVERLRTQVPDMDDYVVAYLRSICR